MIFDITSVRRRLPGRDIDWFESLESTMIEAARTGRIVGAEEQTAGKGRHGRTWHSPAGAGIYVSIPLRLPTATPVVTLALGLAARAAIMENTRLTPDLRWPNDVLVRGRKCAGILVQAALWGRPPVCPTAQYSRNQTSAGWKAGGSQDWPPHQSSQAEKVLKSSSTAQQGRSQIQPIRTAAAVTGGAGEATSIIAGIGINVSQTGFPDGLDTPATSLALEGARVSREDLLVALVHAVDRYCKILSEEGVDAITRQFVQASSYASGRRVRAEAAGRNVEGVTSGLDPSGFLIVREDNGSETTILAGGVRPA